MCDRGKDDECLDVISEMYPGVHSLCQVARSCCGVGMEAYLIFYVFTSNRIAPGVACVAMGMQESVLFVTSFFRLRKKKC